MKTVGLEAQVLKLAAQGIAPAPDDSTAAPETVTDAPVKEISQATNTAPMGYVLKDDVWFPITLNQAGSAPNPTTPPQSTLTDSQKRNRAIFIGVAVLAVLIILILLVTKSKK